MQQEKNGKTDHVKTKDWKKGGGGKQKADKETPVNKRKLREREQKTLRGGEKGRKGGFE